MNPAASDPAAPAAAGRDGAASGRLLFGAVALVALLALVLVGLLWKKVNGMQEQLARQSAGATVLATEARTLANNAQETVRAAVARQAVTDTRVEDIILQRAQLDELVRRLSRSQDDHLLVEVESAIRLAQEQSQATGNVRPLLAALRAGEQRLAQAAQPRLAPLRRAMQHDADRIRATASGDGGEALAQLDELMRGVDDLPALNALGVPDGGGGGDDPAPAPPASAPWWRHLIHTVSNEARSLVRVSRIDRPEAVLLSPDQSFFLRENLKLQLLSARLALLSRQSDRARAELSTVAGVLNRYFDPASRRVQRAATLLQQLQSLVKATEPPRADDTLAALAAAAAAAGR